MRLMSFRSVVLPLPLRPRRTRVSPRETVSETFETIGTARNIVYVVADIAKFDGDVRRRFGFRIHFD